MPTKEDHGENGGQGDADDGPWKNAVSLSADGKLEGLELEGPSASALWQPPAPRPPAPLELAETPPPAPPSEPEGARRSNTKPLVAIAATLLLCALVIGALIFRPGASGPAQSATAPAAAASAAAGASSGTSAAANSTQAPTGQAGSGAAVAPASAPMHEDSPAGIFALTVQSVPGGATVFVAGEEKGRTPLLGNNDFATGAQVEVRVELAGYRTWIGKLTGGANASLDVRLRRR